MVERIIEDDALVLHQVHSLVSDPHASTLCAQQRQMHSQLLASGAIVGNDVRPWRQG